MTFSITIKIAEAGTALASGGNSLVGHTWFVLNSVEFGPTSFGFAPAVHGEAFGQGKVYTSDDVEYQTTSYSRTIELTDKQYREVLKFAMESLDEGTYGDYNGLRNSCIDFVYTALRQLGMVVEGRASDGLVWPSWNDDLYDSLLNTQLPRDPDELTGYTARNAGNYSEGLHGRGTNDNLQGGSATDWLAGYGGSDKLAGEGGDDFLYGGAGDDYLNGGSGADKLRGGLGNDWLGYTAAGESAGSTAERDSSGNYYEGGVGLDHIFGSSQADIIRFNQGDGTDIVTGNGGDDVLEYAASGVSLSVSREGKDLILTRALQDGQFDRIVLQNWYADKKADAMRLSRVDLGAIDAATGQFVVSGTVNQQTMHDLGLSRTIASNAQELRGDLMYYQETLQGSDREDWLYSSQAADENSVGDVLVSGKGNDYLYGSIGADKVRIYAGDGTDVFRGNGGADIIEVYESLTFKSSSTHFDQIGKDLVITFSDSTQLTVRDWTREGASMVFRDGTEGFAVNSEWVAQHLTGIYGDASANAITGNAQANVLYGYAGGDSLVGGGGNDEFWGGADNDQLVGGTGNDVFHYSRGDGIDDVWGGGGSDVLDFQGSGVGYPITATRTGSDLRLSYSPSDSVTVHDWFSSSNASMQVKLPNGQLLSAATVNAGFNSTTMGWTNGVYDSSNFLAVLYGLSSNYRILDQNYQATWGKSFFASAFNGAAKNYYAGFSVDGQPVYSWGAGMGNQYATPGTILYGDVWWNFWSNGNGGYKFVITTASAGQVVNGWSYDSGNPGGLNWDHISKSPGFYYSNQAQALPVTKDSYVLYNGTKMAGTVSALQAKQSLDASDASDFDTLMALNTAHTWQDEIFASNAEGSLTELHRVGPLRVGAPHDEGFVSIVGTANPILEAYSMV